MKHKFNKKQKEYHLKRGEYLYIPCNLSNCLSEYKISSNRSLGCIYIKMNGRIEKVQCGLEITLKRTDDKFEIVYNIFTDVTEDEVRFDIE